jgi:hypothetical protein
MSGERDIPEQAGRSAGGQLHVPAAIVAQSLGRAPAGNVANVTANLIALGTLYGDRINQVDLRVAKLFGSRGPTKVQIDLFNLFKLSGGSLLQPDLQSHQHDVADADLGACRTGGENRRDVRL